MELQRIKRDFSVCKVTDYSKVNLNLNIVLSGKRMRRILWYV